jgi:carboxymethylenebutenolidase
VIVVQEAFGVNRYIERVTERFAGAGFDAVAPHFFHRAGGGTAPYDDFAQVIPLYEGLTDEGILVDLDAALAHLESLGHARDAIGIVGFCFGGRVTFLAAARRTFGAAVGFYGGGIVTPRFPQFPALAGASGDLKAAWLGLFGDQDGSIPVEDVEALRVALRDAPVPTDIVRYEQSEHGFFCDERPSFDPAASDDAWARTMHWFDAHLAGAR